MMSCKHENLQTVCKVVRYEEYLVEGADHRMAEITISCIDCGAPFHFQGPGGLHPKKPMTGPFGEELRAPIVAGETPKGHSRRERNN